MANPAQMQSLGNRTVDMGYEYPFASLGNIIPSLALGRGEGKVERYQKQQANLASLLPSLAAAGRLAPTTPDKANITFGGMPLAYVQPPMAGDYMNMGTDALAGLSLDQASKIISMKKNMADLMMKGKPTTSEILSTFNTMMTNPTMYAEMLASPDPQAAFLKKLKETSGIIKEMKNVGEMMYDNAEFKSRADFEANQSRFSNAPEGTEIIIEGWKYKRKGDQFVPIAPVNEGK